MGRFVPESNLPSATARTAPVTFLLDVRRFLREAAADEKIEKSALLTWPYGDALLHVSVMNEQAAAKPAHIELKFGETVQRASAMALDAP